jgi:PAS domain S-box-containing protein
MSLNSSRQITVLHVDDDPEFADLTGSFLEREDDQFAVETATSADEGMKRINACPPDCVVSDYDMPHVDGLEFLRAVREEYPDLPFVLFTGKGSEAVASDAIAAGVTDYLQKESGTSHYTVLANRISNAVEAARSGAKAERRHHRLEQILKTVPGCVVQLDADGQFVFANERAEEILGLETDEVTQRAYNDPEWELQQPNGEPIPDEKLPFRQVCDTGEPIYNAEHAITWPDGSRKILSVNAAPLFDETGDVESVVGSLSDITDRRERQRELRLLQQSIDDTNVPITLADPSREDNPLIYVNDAFEEMTGYPSEETLGRNYRFLHGEETDSEKSTQLREAIDNEESISVELRNYRKDGTEFWNRLTVTPIYDDDELVRYLGTHEEVTERKERERELRAERRFVEQALDSLDDLFYVLATDGTLRRWNDQANKVTGYTDRELAGMQATELFPEDEREAIATAIGTTLEDGRATVEADLLAADGERLPYEFTGARLTDEDGNVANLVGIGRDLTERRQRERRFQALVEESRDNISVIDADGRFQYQSPAIERVLGYEPKETIGDTVWEYVHPDDRERLESTLEEWVATPGATGAVEYRARHADGSWRWMEANGNNQLDNPAVEGYVINSRDVTEHKQREQEMRELKRQYQTLAESFPSGAVYLIDRELEYVRAGGEELNSVGLSPADIEGRTPHDLFPEEIADETRHYYEQALDGTASTFEQEYGGERYRIRTVPVQADEEIDHVMAVAQNITEYAENRRELERQNERLEEFTSIVSHDLRNPLTVADGYLELAQDKCESDHLARAADAIDRSQALVDDLLTLARGGRVVAEAEPVDLADVAGQSWQTAETGAATLATDASQTIKADRSRLQQLFENLYRNSVEHGGDDVTVSVGATEGGFYVADTGSGISESEREEVFEAGYSTNEQGTGFGLRIVEQVAEAHGWEVAVTESEQGGARFEVTAVAFAER